MPSNGGANYAVTISTSPTLIMTHDSRGAWRKFLTLVNMSDVTIYIGRDNAVTTATGFPLDPDERRSESDYCGYVYGIVETGTAELRVDVY